MPKKLRGNPCVQNAPHLKRYTNKWTNSLVHYEKCKGVIGAQNASQPQGIWFLEELWPRWRSWWKEITVTSWFWDKWNPPLAVRFCLTRYAFKKPEALTVQKKKKKNRDFGVNHTWSNQGFIIDQKPILEWVSALHQFSEKKNSIYPEK